VAPVGGEQRIPLNVEMAGQRHGHQLLSQAGVYGSCHAATREKLKQTFLKGTNENRRPGECR
jgi:hypothetical protein